MDGRTFEGHRIVVQPSSIVILLKIVGHRRDYRSDRDRRNNSKLPRKKGPQVDDVCYNCGRTGHWYVLFLFYKLYFVFFLKLIYLFIL